MLYVFFVRVSLSIKVFKSDIQYAYSVLLCWSISTPSIFTEIAPLVVWTIIYNAISVFLSHELKKTSFRKSNNRG